MMEEIHILQPYGKPAWKCNEGRQSWKNCRETPLEAHLIAGLFCIALYRYQFGSGSQYLQSGNTQGNKRNKLFSHVYLLDGDSINVFFDKYLLLVNQPIPQAYWMVFFDSYF